MFVPNFKRIALFVQKLLGVPKFRNWVTWPKPRPLRVWLGSCDHWWFYGPHAVGVSPPSLYQIWSGSLNSFNSYKAIPKFQNGVMWPLAVVLWSMCRRGPSSMSLPNLKGIAQFVQKLWGVPKFRNWVTWSRPRPLGGRFVIPTH